MTHCPAYWRLYLALTAACVQYAPPMDAQEAAALASAERDDESRRQAVDAIREHTRTCKECHGS